MFLLLLVALFVLLAIVLGVTVHGLFFLLLIVALVCLILYFVAGASRGV